MSDPSLADRLRAMRDEVRERLMETSRDYRNLLVLEEAIRHVSAQVVVDIGARRASLPESPQERTISQVESTLATLEEKGEPQRVADLADLVRAKGVAVSGKQNAMVSRINRRIPIRMLRF